MLNYGDVLCDPCGWSPRHLAIKKNMSNSLYGQPGVCDTEAAKASPKEDQLPAIT